MCDSQSDPSLKRQRENDDEEKVPVRASKQRVVEKLLVNRTVHHVCLSQTNHASVKSAGSYCFVVGADPQLGMRTANRDWNTEMEYCERTVTYINSMASKPAFVCMCGDLVDMEAMAYTGKYGTEEECVRVQEQQYDDFSRIFSRMDADIPLLCLCGNHGEMSWCVVV